jgi:carbon monoxide dehydrogenase subunit G
MLNQGLITQFRSVDGAGRLCRAGLRKGRVARRVREEYVARIERFGNRAVEAIVERMRE